MYCRKQKKIKIKNNFYEWLKLPVEKFESDPAKLKLILEKTRKNGDRVL